MTALPAFRAAVRLACASALAAACVQAGACDDDDGPRRGPARDTGTREPDADLPFNGFCGTQACETTTALVMPGCCTGPGTAEPGHLLENTGRAPGLCGTDVGLLIPALEGTCVQLDQPGEIDAECPAQEPLHGGARMPGCCTDEGYCGAMETIIGFGCFYATGAKGRPCTPDPDADGGA